MISFKNFKGFKNITDIHDHYVIGRELGSGSFGTVSLGQHAKAGTEVAIKHIKKKKLAEAPVYQELMRSELEILEKVDHPHITRVFELLEDKSNYYVVMEYLKGGNLLDKIITQSKFSER